MADIDLARRMFEARNHLERELGKRVTFAELGELVAAAQPDRDEGYSASVVARWIKAEQEPQTRGGWLALARGLRVDPGWLAFGTGTMVGSRIEPPSSGEDPTVDGELVAVPAPHPRRALGVSRATKRRKGQR